MKKCITFIISFILLFLIFQVMSGMFLTLTYKPDIGEAWNAFANLSQGSLIKSHEDSFLLIFILASLSALFAYFILRKVSSKKVTH